MYKGYNRYDQLKIINNSRYFFNLHKHNMHTESNIVIYQRYKGNNRYHTFKKIIEDLNFLKF